jgi:D-alanyl-lipoteichoic acid acyltransferase DltB (MBOAT superfamily)
MTGLDFKKILEQLAYDPANPLLFNSSFFLFFFTIFLFFYQFIYKHKMSRVLMFTLFSLYFFYKACGYYFLIIVLSAIVDFIISNAIYKYQNRLTLKKTLLVFSVTINLGLLFYFKYTNFFIELVNDFSSSHINPLHLVLPIGISFYTFENLSYTIDVYRGEFKPVKRFLDYCFFLSFFPKLMMGPIVRAKDFIPQIRKTIAVSEQDIGTGFYLIVGGLFKKMVISDFIYTHLVEGIFNAPMQYTGLECLLAVYGYALVIYCDFSGYSDMAIGMARWMGFVIPANFNSPYQSLNITEFWRRWHISLSSWLKDYVYIPLGGNKKGNSRKYVNLVITMLIGGFWHGASWNFLLWGALHGFALAFDKLLREKFGLFKTKTRFSKALGLIITFHFVCFCWIFFKAGTFETAKQMISQIAFHFNGSVIFDLVANYKTVILLIVSGYVLHAVPKQVEWALQNKLATTPVFLKTAILIAVVWIAILSKDAEPVMPIYLQF